MGHTFAENHWYIKNMHLYNQNYIDYWVCMKACVYGILSLFEEK